MHSMRFSPLFAALVMTQRAWDKIPERYHAPFQAAAQQVAEKLSSTALQVDEFALDMMKSVGLQVHSSTAEMERDWDRILQEYFYDSLIGAKVIDPVAYKKVQEALTSYRENNSTN